MRFTGLWIYFDLSACTVTTSKGQQLSSGQKSLGDLPCFRGPLSRLIWFPGLFWGLLSAWVCLLTHIVVFNRSCVLGRRHGGAFVLTCWWSLHCWTFRCFFFSRSTSHVTNWSNRFSIVLILCKPYAPSYTLGVMAGLRSAKVAMWPHLSTFHPQKN